MCVCVCVCVCVPYRCCFISLVKENPQYYDRLFLRFKEDVLAFLSCNEIKAQGLGTELDPWGWKEASVLLKGSLLQKYHPRTT